jgi:hypothetical protein
MAGEVDEQLMLAMAEFAGHQLISPFGLRQKRKGQKQISKWQPRLASSPQHLHQCIILSLDT